MKKLLCIVAALFCLTACGGSAESKTVSCNTTDKNTGYTMENTVDFTYVGSLVKKQEQKTVMKLENQATYDQMKPIVDASSLEATVKDMDGVSYSLDYNDKDFTISQTMTIDITKISTSDYATLTNQSSSAVKTMKIDMEKTRTSFVSQGYTCTEMK